jgi:hypothetical protein
VIAKNTSTTTQIIFLKPFQILKNRGVTRNHHLEISEDGLEKFTLAKASFRSTLQTNQKLKRCQRRLLSLRLKRTRNPNVKR